MNREQKQSRSQFLPLTTLGLSGVLLLLYAAPWLSGNTAAFTYNAYDLAEWTSLHPTVRGGSPPLLTTLLLRLPLACVALMLVFSTRPARRGWWLAIGLVLLIAFALLPPLEFFTGAFGDPNYQQQTVLSLLVLLGALLSFSRRIAALRPYLAAITGILMVTASLIGLSQAQPLFAQFNIAVAPTVAPYLFVVAAILMTLPLVLGKQKK